MAKKGQAVQLQQELNTDEDWDKMMQRPGLILVDIYSEWSGPCSAMIANLKKVKVEVGGDNLQFAIAKSDSISYLERFRGTCEPIWMFIVEGKMVNLMFGANAPKLMRLLVQELKKEDAVREGTSARKTIEVTELADEERVRYEIAKRIEDEAIRIEIERKARVLKERRLAVANVVLENLPLNGVIIVFPHAVPEVQAVLAELWEPAGLAIANTEKPFFTMDMLEELMYFMTTEFSEADVENLISGKSLAYLVKPYDADLFTDDIDQAVAEFVYGPSKCPPGSPDSVAQVLMGHIPVPKEEPVASATGLHSKEPSLGALPSMPSLSAIKMPSATKQSKVVMDRELQSKTEIGSKGELRSKTDVGSKGEMRSKTQVSSKTKMQSKTGVTSKTVVFSTTSLKEVPEEETIEVTGLWTPPNANTKATAIKLLFPKVYDPIALPEPVPIPPHIAIAFEAYRRREIYELMKEYSEQIMRYGFFTSDHPEEAKLIAKTLPKFEKLKQTKSFEGEKLVIQISRKRSEAWCVFSQQNPTFMSHTPQDGEEQCKFFFPEGYDEVEEEEEEVVEVKKKKRGKKGEAAKKTAVEEAVVETQEEEEEEEGGEEEEGAIEEGEGEEGVEEEEAQGDDLSDLFGIPPPSDD